MSFSKFPLFFASLFLLFFISNCQNDAKNTPGVQSEAAPAPPQPSPADFSGDEKNKNLDVADAQTSADPFLTQVAKVGRLDSLKKFVRTAELRFQVAEVIQSTLEIEQIAVKNGGFVLSSNLENLHPYQNIKPISRDSAIETYYIGLESKITLRVPFQKLDTSLREIGRQSTMFNYRRVRAEDVSLQFIENELNRLSLGNYQQNLNTISATPGAASQSKLEAAKRNFESQTASDRTKMEDLKMADAIRFSTVQIEIYQKTETRQRKIANPEIADVRPNFGFRAGKALANGWFILEDLIFGVFSIWPLILLFAGGYFFFKKYVKRSAKP